MKGLHWKLGGTGAVKGLKLLRDWSCEGTGAVEGLDM